MEALKTSDEFARFPHRERPVLQLALTKEDVSVLKELRDARADTKEKEAVEVLLGILEGRSSPCDFFDLDEVPEAWRAEAIKVYLSALDTEDLAGDAGWKALKAAYWLGRLKVNEAVPGLLRLIRHPGIGGYCVFKDTASYYQPMAGWALVQIAEPTTLQKLEEIARDRTQSRYARSSALVAYGRLARAKAVPVLAAVLQDEDNVWGWEGIVTREYPAFPSFNSHQEGAACALADVGDEAARAALVAYLQSGRRLTSDIVAAISRVDRNALDAWSRKHLDSNDWKQHDWAVGIRFTYFPDSVAPIVLQAFSKKPDERNYTWDNSLKLLQHYALNDPKVTSELIRLLATDTGEPVPGAKLGEPLACNRRIRLVEAISRQGDTEAEDALIEFAEKGKLAPK